MTIEERFLYSLNEILVLGRTANSSYISRKRFCCLRIKISKYEQKFWYFPAGFENIDFLGEKTKFFQTHTYFFPGLMTIRTVYECCEKVLKQKTR